MTHQIPSLKKEWHTASHEIAVVLGKNGKQLSVQTRFDGHGNSIVRFVIETKFGKTEYEKFDAAVEAYNMLP
jgi:hypothetical protein